ncbi:hypothetical protein INN71_01005 [Nocardioides sp. ChNu-153]|uniref:hypothetical protein n=1 Tax=unclassified Nocardioides TaxID=2615069 RepID=UPI00240525FE|nr:MULTISPECIES: hypothetical protein [unclassified Nocardioides]MDF9715995.1 hypothetical protein [Nocardioides sp. ChNu-99]MDN7119963.1 hypothetical protein [Nocardioides sp. ChNu-153]
MNPRTSRLAHLAVAATLTVVLAGCGDGTGADDTATDRGTTNTADTADTADTAEDVYAAWRTSILEDDLEAFEQVSTEAAWSDVVEAPDNEAHHAALVEAAATGALELPEDPDAEVGREEVLGSTGDEEGADPGWEEFAASVEEELDITVDDVAVFVVPFTEAYEGDAAALFVRSTDEGWLFFGMEPAQ